MAFKPAHLGFESGDLTALSLEVFAGFVVAWGYFGAAPMAVLIPLYMLELIVALSQAFVFTILTCLYLHDAIHLH